MCIKKTLVCVFSVLVAMLGVSCGADSTQGETDDENAENSESDSDSSASCEDACSTIAANQTCAEIGFDQPTCMSFCNGVTCASCLMESSACGENCSPVCEGGASDEETEETEETEDKREPNCQANDDCGVSFECVACKLADTEGWCEQTDECSQSEPCPNGQDCGYNVETSDWRCLPSTHCE